MRTYPTIGNVPGPHRLQPHSYGVVWHKLVAVKADEGEMVPWKFTDCEVGQNHAAGLG